MHSDEAAIEFGAQGTYTVIRHKISGVLTFADLQRGRFSATHNQIFLLTYGMVVAKTDSPKTPNRILHDR